MEQKVRICLQFSNPNQGGGPPSSANPLRTLRRWPHTTDYHRRRRHLRPTRASVPFSDGARRRHRRRRTYLVTNDAVRAVPIPAESGAALPKRQRQLHRRTTYTQSPSPTRRPYTRRSYHFIFPHFSLPARRFVPSDEFAELLARPGPECICQTVKQIGRQLTNTSASLAAAHSSAT